MHDIEPYYNWRHIYTAEEDVLSPFYGTEYSEFEFTNTIYNYYIHPQWDEMGSRTLYLKILMADYETNYAIIELMGEWNDAIENDIQTLKRSIIDLMIDRKIYKFILIAENILNFHSGDAEYYEEWYDDIKEKGGWIVALNMPEQTQFDFKKARLTNYITLLFDEKWRVFNPMHLFEKIDNEMIRYLE